jgi:hypothetical protein
MTTQYAVLKGLPNGLALDAGKLFTLASPDTVVTGNTFSFSNRTNANTQYVVSIVRATALPAGDYTFIAYIGSSPKAEIALTFLGTDGETATETARLAELDSSARVKLAADQPDYVPATAAALATAYALLQLTDTDVASILSTVGAIETKIGTPVGSLSAMVADVPTVSEFEARTIAAASYRQNITLRGTGITEAKAFDLLLASLAGVTSQPSGTTEKFKFLDGNDAFTTTFDTNGNRTGVALA